MAIKKRSLASKYEQAVLEMVDQGNALYPDDDEDDDLQTSASVEDGVDFESIQTEVTPEYAAAERYITFLRGNDMTQPHPKQVDIEELLRGVQHVQNPDDPEFAHIETFYRSRIRSPLTAIRAMCVLNYGGPKAATASTDTEDPLWLFRSGKNPFYGKNRK